MGTQVEDEKHNKTFVWLRFATTTPCTQQRPVHVTERGAAIGLALKPAAVMNEPHVEDKLEAVEAYSFINHSHECMPFPLLISLCRPQLSMNTEHVCFLYHNQHLSCELGSANVLSLILNCIQSATHYLAALRKLILRKNANWTFEILVPIRLLRNLPPDLI